MSCGCGKKKGAMPLMGLDSQALLPVTEWGPILWRYLHCITERIGHSGNTIVDTDQANYMEVLLTLLPQIIPCKECQEHAASYQQYSAVPPLRGQYGAALRDTVRNWLFAFHNHVRSRKEQTIEFYHVEQCAAHYANCALSKQEYNSFIQTVAGAVRQGWVRMENWRKWYSHSERIRIICGNVVV